MQEIGGLNFLHFLYTHFINLLRKRWVCEKAFTKGMIY